MESFFSNPTLFSEDILNRMHIFAGPWLDYIMLSITTAGSVTFYTLALPILYWCWDRKKALYAGATFLLAMSLNDILKQIINHPRPDPAKLLPGLRELAYRSSPKGPGFPSGHAQGSITFWGTLALMERNWTVTAAALLMIILVPFSRLYLGVHFLGDVIGGLIIGLFCLAVTLPATSITENYYRTVNEAIIISALMIIPYLLYKIMPGDHINSTMGTISGFLIGAFLAKDRIRFNPRNRLRYQLIKIAVGVAGFAIISFGLKRILPDIPIAGYFRYWCIGFWCSFAAPSIFGRIKALR